MINDVFLKKIQELESAKGKVTKSFIDPNRCLINILTDSFNYQRGTLYYLDVKINDRMTLRIEYRINKNSKIAIIDDIYTGDYSNLGIGTILITYLEDLLRKLGVTKITGKFSWIDESHYDRQLAFYEKNGYVIDCDKISKDLMSKDDVFTK